MAHGRWVKAELGIGGLPRSGRTAVAWVAVEKVPGRAGAGSPWLALGWLLPLAVQVAHTIAVAPTYHVGSVR